GALPSSLPLGRRASAEALTPSAAAATCSREPGLDWEPVTDETERDEDISRAEGAEAPGAEGAEAPGAATDDAPATPPEVGERPVTRSGFVAIVGKPNVGKSTLLNTMLGVKVAPITPKPQTTRRGVRGIYTFEDRQLVFVDTPGLHRGGDTVLDQAMHREVR